jgi:hypothetical protein
VAFGQIGRQVSAMEITPIGLLVGSRQYCDQRRRSARLDPAARWDADSGIWREVSDPADPPAD